MRKVRFRATARRDVREIMNYIARDRPRAALRFLDAVEKLASRICQFPDLGAAYEWDDEILAELRVFPVPRFKNFLMFYRVEDNVVEIVRILHGARDLPSVLGENA